MGIQIQWEGKGGEDQEGKSKGDRKWKSKRKVTGCGGGKERWPEVEGARKGKRNACKFLGTEYTFLLFERLVKFFNNNFFLVRFAILLSRNAVIFRFQLFAKTRLSANPRCRQYSKVRRLRTSASPILRNHRQPQIFTRFSPAYFWLAGPWKTFVIIYVVDIQYYNIVNYILSQRLCKEIEWHEDGGVNKRFCIMTTTFTCAVRNLPISNSIFSLFLSLGD